jgi:hypothetical protein
VKARQRTHSVRIDEQLLAELEQFARQQLIPAGHRPG